jgi:two-component sensor histidine kinase
MGEALRDVQPIAMNVDAAEIYLPTDHAIPIGLIVNELVTNCLKHAFPDGQAGTIEVSLQREAGFTLIVRDNGTDCPAFKADGVGIRLVRLLVQQLGAQIEWQQPACGCQVRVVFRSLGLNSPHRARPLQSRRLVHALRVPTLYQP